MPSQALQKSEATSSICNVLVGSRSGQYICRGSPSNARMCTLDSVGFEGRR